VYQNLSFKNIKIKIDHMTGLLGVCYYNDLEAEISITEQNGTFTDASTKTREFY